MSDVLEQWRSAKERWIISGEANEMIVGLENEIERLREALRRAETILSNMAEENNSMFNRWPVHHEPLRADARNLLPQIRAALGEGEEEKQLVWPNPSPPTEGVSPYNHVKAHGFTIEWKSWKDRPQYTLVRDHKDEEFLGSFDTLEDAKEAARAALGEGKE